MLCAVHSVANLVANKGASGGGTAALNARGSSGLETRASVYFPSVYFLPVCFNSPSKEQKYLLGLLPCLLLPLVTPATLDFSSDNATVCRSYVRF